VEVDLEARRFQNPHAGRVRYDWPFLIEDWRGLLFDRRVLENISLRKQELRQLAKENVRGLSTETRRANSQAACELFLGQEPYRRSDSLLLYVALTGELDVRFIFERAQADGKRVALPRFLPETQRYGAFFAADKPLVAGAFGILEPALDNPVPLNRLDLVVVPGVGFDARGRRLGRGKGFYDRILSEATGVKCGICFEEQLLETIPVEPHDVGVDFLATPSRWLDCRGSTPEEK
jgi:5-formyltetrahydrofolate cyclo-ligase